MEQFFVEYWSDVCAWLFVGVVHVLDVVLLLLTVVYVLAAGPVYVLATGPVYVLSAGPVCVLVYGVMFVVIILGYGGDVRGYHLGVTG